MECGLPAALISDAWLRNTAELKSGTVTENDLVSALAVCLKSEPDKLTFFWQDYAKWRSRALALSEEAARTERERKAARRRREQDRREQREKAEILDNPDARAQVEEALRRLHEKLPGLSRGPAAERQAGRDPDGGSDDIG